MVESDCAACTGAAFPFVDAGGFCDSPSAGRHPTRRSAATSIAFIGQKYERPASRRHQAGTASALGSRMRTFLVWVESGGPLVVPVVIVGIATIALLIEQTISIVVRS